MRGVRDGLHRVSGSVLLILRVGSVGRRLVSALGSATIEEPSLSSYFSYMTVLLRHIMLNY